MPSLREDKQPDAVIDLRHGSLQRAPTDEVVLVEDGLPELPPEPVFSLEPVLLDGPGSTRKKRRVAELEAIVATNARAAVEARGVALEQRRYLEDATAAWHATVAELVALRRDLKGFASARADLIAKERPRAEQAARTHVEAELQQLGAERDGLQTEIDRLRAALTEQQGLNGDSTARLRDEQRKRAEAEGEAKRAIAAYETAERRLETASEALQRHATDEQARIDVAEAARAAAEAELEALGGGGQVAKLTSRVEDLVAQLAELDEELAAAEARAEVAETTAADATATLETATAAAERAGAHASRVEAQLDEILRERDTLRVKVASLEEIGEQAEARDAATQHDAAEARDRATVARVRLDEIAHERDALVATVAGLEDAAEERERRAADDLARATAALELADTSGLEEQLVAARFEAETLRGETSALAAQLEEAHLQVEEARRLAEAARDERAARPPEPALDVESVDPAAAELSILDAFAELAAPPAADDHTTERAVEPDARIVPPPPDPEDPDARRAALGFLNSLARDLPTTRPEPDVRRT